MYENASKSNTKKSFFGTIHVMSKDFIAVGLETEVVRAVRFAEKGKEFVRVDAFEWQILPISDGDDAESATDAGSALTADAPTAVGDTDEAVAQVDRLAEIFREIVARYKTREIVLALPLSMMLAKSVRLPLAERDALEEDARSAIDKMSPFPDEDLVVGVEDVGETDSEVLLVAAALPEAASMDVGDALDAAKVRVTRTDVTALGVLRGMWESIVENKVGRRLVFVEIGGEWDVMVMDHDSPTLLRGLGSPDAASLAREATLSLLQSSGGAPEEVVVVSAVAPGEDVAKALGAFAPVRHVAMDDPFAAVEGCALRTVS